MQKQRTAMIAALCTLVLICVFAGTFFFSSMSYQTERFRVTLPKELEGTEELNTEAMEQTPQLDIELPELSPENVQEVILSLPRLTEYSSSVTNSLYLNDGTSASWRAVTYVKNDAQRIERYNVGETLPQISLYYEDQIHMWEQGSSAVWSASAGAFTGDMTAMIPSYLDVCALPIESIAKAETQYLDNVPCIFVTCANGTEYVISMVTGLLEQVCYFENEEVVREVKIVSTEEEIADSLFVLPGETDPIFTQKEE